MTAGKVDNGVSAKTTAVLFGAVVVLWLLLDRLTKSAVDTVNVGTVLQRNVLGSFDFVLVHNTGAAWGLFAGSTTALGWFSVIVCIALTVLLFAWLRKEANIGTVIGCALVVAGGLGNAIDRFAQSYVTDFISFNFIDFPVLNVADIGVTCGIVLLLASVIYADAHSRRNIGGAAS